MSRLSGWIVCAGLLVGHVVWYVSSPKYLSRWRNQTAVRVSPDIQLYSLWASPMSCIDGVEYSQDRRQLWRPLLDAQNFPIRCEQAAWPPTQAMKESQP